MNDKPVDYSAMRFWFDIGQYVVTIGIGVYVWLGNRLNAKNEEVKRVKKDVITIKERVTKLETDMVHTLSHEDLGAVYERINDVAEEVAELSGKMDGVKGGLDMIHEHLLSEVRR